MAVHVTVLVGAASTARADSNLRVARDLLALAARSLRHARCVAMAVHVTVLVGAASTARARRHLGII